MTADPRSRLAIPGGREIVLEEWRRRVAAEPLPAISPEAWNLSREPAAIERGEVALPRPAPRAPATGRNG